jgi:ribonuclease BN (tRNA processing enzyme)
VQHDGASFAYVPDAIDDNDDAMLDLATDVDVLVRGAPFVTAESERARDFGHGTAEHAVDIAERVGAGRLVLTHHAPTRSDDDVEAIAARVGAIAAIEGMTLTVR